MGNLNIEKVKELMPKIYELSVKEIVLGIYHNAKKKNRIQKRIASAENLRIKRKTYKNALHSANRDYKVRFNREVRNMKFKNQKLYWKMFSNTIFFSIFKLKNKPKLHCIQQGVRQECTGIRL